MLPRKLMKKLKRSRLGSKWNKKGIMDDAVDFMFTVLLCFLLLLFIGMVVKGGIDAKNKQSLELTTRMTKVDNYLLEKRVELEEKKKIEIEQLKKDISTIRKLGYVPGSADDPYLREVPLD